MAWELDPSALTDWLRDHEPAVQALWVFGSHAAGRAHEESDLDLAVLLDRRSCPDAEARFACRLRLGAELGALLCRNDVDLVILDDAPPLFARAILDSGRRLYTANAQAVRDFERDTRLQAADLAPFMARARQRWLARLAS